MTERSHPDKVTKSKSVDFDEPPGEEAKEETAQGQVSEWLGDLVDGSVMTSGLLEKRLVHQVLKNESERMNHCLTLPLTFLFLIIFVVGVESHSNIYSANRGAEGLRNIVENTGFMTNHMTIYDIQTTGDWWQWVETAFAPIFLQTENEVDGSPKDSTYAHMIMRHHRKIGGVVMEQVRYKAPDCMQLDGSGSGEPCSVVKMSEYLSCI